MKTKKLLVLALCLLCAGQAFGLPKNKKNKNNNKVSNSVPQEEDSDLIPIPDHLIEDCKYSGKIHSAFLSPKSLFTRNFKINIVKHLLCILLLHTSVSSSS